MPASERFIDADFRTVYEQTTTYWEPSEKKSYPGETAVPMTLLLWPEWQRLP